MRRRSGTQAQRRWDEREGLGSCTAQVQAGSGEAGATCHLRGGWLREGPSFGEAGSRQGTP